jgi:2,3-bisphosphoglycerate-independent phosphoglycerate mutase
MKYIVVIGDGMADEQLEILNGRTPMEIADTKWMDFIAKGGKVGLLQTLDKKMPLGSEVANLSILGYDPKTHYPGGRGPLEALAMGVKLKEGEIAIRFNFITEREGIMEHYSAGNISTKEAKELVHELNKKLGMKRKEEMRFYPGKGYRGVLVLKNPKNYSEKVKCKAPHEIKKKLLEDNFAQPILLNEKSSKRSEETANLLNELTLKSKDILPKHMINKKRISEGKLPANMIWFWGPGRYTPIEKFEDKFNISGSLISAVTLLKGIGTAIGLEVIDVPGVNSFFDTNYEGKADYAIKALEKRDFVYLHIKAPDDLSHKRDVERKIKAIERIDKFVVGRLLKKLKSEIDDFKISVLPDHATSTKTGEHILDPVPFAIYSSSSSKEGEKGIEIDSVKEYSEKAARKGSYGLVKGHEFMNLLLEK